MPRFAYTARDGQDRAVHGDLDAPSRREAARALSARGLQPVALQESGATPQTSRHADKPESSVVQAPGSGHSSAVFSARERLPFLKALATLVSSGYSAGEALRLLPRRLKDARLRALSLALWEQLSTGATLSGAMEGFPATFDAQTINLVRAGEATGNLKEVLHRLVNHFTARQQLHRRIIAAFCYPVFICVVAAGVLLFFALFLLPRLQGLLTSLGGDLPLPTRILLAVSHGALIYGPFLAALAAAAWIWVWRWRKTEAGRKKTDALILDLPLVGPLMIDVSVQNFSQTLAVLLENGVTTVEALRIAERGVPNRALAEGLRTAADAVIEGQSLTQALARVPRLPEAVIDRLSIGENTGVLAPHLRDLSQGLEEELTHRLKVMTDALSTGVLLVAFSFVGFIAYAIVSAVFQVSTSFKV